MNKVEKAREIIKKLALSDNFEDVIYATEEAKTMAAMRKAMTAPAVSYGLRHMSQKEIDKVIDIFKEKEKEWPNS